MVVLVQYYYQKKILLWNITVDNPCESSRQSVRALNVNSLYYGFESFIFEIDVRRKQCKKCFENFSDYLWLFFDVTVQKVDSYMDWITLD